MEKASKSSGRGRTSEGWLTTRSKRELDDDYAEAQMAATQSPFDPTYTSTQMSKKVKTEPSYVEKETQTESFLHSEVGLGVIDINKKLDKILFKEVKDKQTQTLKEVKDNETQTLEKVDETTGQFNDLLTQNDRIIYELKCVKGVLRQYLERE